MEKGITVKPKPDEIECLYAITKAIHASLDLRQSLYKVLDLLSERLGMNRGSITLLNKDTGQIHIEVAHGISPTEQNRGRYKLGEGITGRVIESGRAMAVPRLDGDPFFLDRTKARKKLDKSKVAFLCVPVKEGGRVIGALSVDRTSEGENSFGDELRILSIISTLIAEKVSVLERINRETDELREENLRLRRELNRKYSFSNIIGNSRKMQEVFHLITQVAKSNANVLLLGESGTGKELVANAIHFNSLRAERPCIKVNCAALPSNLVEAELFGHEKGAFTGASRQKMGKFELANGGTIFLDEIGSLALESQGKLLRVLQERELERLGGTETLKVNVRLIAATNKDLSSAVEAGSFREDLFYRLNVYPIYLPALREREADILLLADYFLEKYAGEYKKDIKRISTPAIDALVQYHWPGNVRELESCIERAVLLCDDQVIHSYHLPPTLQTAKDTGTQQAQSLEEAVDRFEREILIDALKTTRGNMRKAAHALNTTERIFGYKVRKYAIEPKRYR
ncbi:MAG: sigma-54-dependent Fis family transcriptional regulator [Deltaproteobacteria bacterium CG23_combo_of_CG06-09_8_20_14_all_51_20]|nr:GAF domain-containing protein [bacterium]OIP40055.1 MAG: sigma-54-dependent Fis family transcriptional regulator [Desulfobacteraceae bacterium CG2_30_51_40]PIP45657.1 MAG: sigma-54-dependent Fis family transcriptional regulator [Deltaproteobacteria bacterium CG23_combo_of_CG06-09_8_20_14_all_51_20]PIY24530.1 MAG: sigma-54-dependent Fis family transcriptional regulator [Deltaproteobacteria bacterium CG_4_10_14_3_um_filter_51_14]PJB33894.1 MAG: sigma-54-dependent Fis family transcriptional reg